LAGNPATRSAAPRLKPSAKRNSSYGVPSATCVTKLMTQGS
jgi:hypothetical protein